MQAAIERSSLPLAGNDTISDMQAKGHNTVGCQYCGKSYLITTEDFTKMLNAKN